MEQSRIEESVSVSSSSVDIFVLSPTSLGLTLFFLSLHTCVICPPCIPPHSFFVLRCRSTSHEMAWVDGLLQRKSLLIRPCSEMGD